MYFLLSFITIFLDNLYERLLLLVVLLQGRTGDLAEEKYVEY